MIFTQPMTRAEQDTMADRPVKVGDTILMTFKTDPKNVGTNEWNLQLARAREAFLGTELGKKCVWDMKGTKPDLANGLVTFKFDVVSNPFPLIWAVVAAVAIVAAASMLTLDKIEHVSKSPVAATLAFGLLAVLILAALFMLGIRFKSKKGSA